MTEIIDRKTGEIISPPAKATSAPTTALAVIDADVARETRKLLAQPGLFPTQLTEGQAAMVARVALAYGLDPYVGELTVLGGKVYIGLDGRLRKAGEHPMYDGSSCEPATEEERAAFRCREDEDLWVAHVYRKDRRMPAKAWGRCSATAESVIGQGGEPRPNIIARRWSQEMAYKRALQRALRMAFHLPIPGVEEGDQVAGEEMVTPGQLKAIHAMAHLAGMGTSPGDDDEYRKLLRGATGREHANELTWAEATAVLDTLKVELGRTDRVQAELDTRFLQVTAPAPEGLPPGITAPGPQVPVHDENGIPFRPATTEQIETIERLAPTSVVRNVNWAHVSHDAAAIWLHSLHAHEYPEGTHATPG